MRRLTTQNLCLKCNKGNDISYISLLLIVLVGDFATVTIDAAAAAANIVGFLLLLFFGFVFQFQWFDVV